LGGAGVAAGAVPAFSAGLGEQAAKPALAPDNTAAIELTAETEQTMIP